jgi:hypothetical protein
MMNFPRIILTHTILVSHDFLPFHVGPTWFQFWRTVGYYGHSYQSGAKCKPYIVQGPGLLLTCSLGRLACVRNVIAPQCGLRY